VCGATEDDMPETSVHRMKDYEVACYGLMKALFRIRKWISLVRSKKTGQVQSHQPLGKRNELFYFLLLFYRLRSALRQKVSESGRLESNPGRATPKIWRKVKRYLCPTSVQFRNRQ